MKENENLYDKIKELIGKDPGRLSILEDNIDVDLQVEYFELSKRMAQEHESDWALEQIDLLNDPDYPIDGKKELLARLASIENVAAYRAIESYSRNPDNLLREWSLLALQESRMHLESHFLEENQVFISTGLGGRNDKLRYFIALIARNREPFTDFQLKIINEEFPYILKKYGAEIEESRSSGYLATFLLLLPIQHSVRQVFTEGIDECNQYGDFLRDHFIVTNVKKLSFQEISDFIERKHAH
ncbi:hypothetical protein ACFLT1_10115 [Bacteroidota bacterium]